MTFSWINKYLFSAAFENKVDIFSVKNGELIASIDNAYLIYDNSYCEHYHKNAKFLIDSRSQRVYEMNLSSILHLGSI